VVGSGINYRRRPGVHLVLERLSRQRHPPDLARLSALANQAVRRVPAHLACLSDRTVPAPRLALSASHSNNDDDGKLRSNKLTSRNTDQRAIIQITRLIVHIWANQ